MATIAAKSPEQKRSEADRDRFFELAKRYIQLGYLLPQDRYDFDTDDIAAVAEATVILDEMHKTKSEMDELLRRNDPRRRPAA
jgi:hypothetical protein